MTEYHLFSNGYYLNSVQKEDGLEFFEYPPASGTTKCNEEDEDLPEPGTNWVKYIVKPLKLIDGRNILIAYHGEEPTPNTVDTLLIR